MTDRGTVTLVGTNHVDEQSRHDVAHAIRTRDPDVVAIELDAERLQRGVDDTRTLRDRLAALADTDLSPVATALVGVLSLSQALQGDDSDATDMVPAAVYATDQDRTLALLDTPIEHTFGRIDDELLTRDALRDAVSIPTSVADVRETLAHAVDAARLWWTADRLGRPLGADDETEWIEALSPDELAELTAAFERLYPRLVEIMLRERDAYMAGRLDALRCDGHDVVAVVGRAHVAGIRDHLEHPSTIPGEHRTTPPTARFDGDLPAFEWQERTAIVDVGGGSA